MFFSGLSRVYTGFVSPPVVEKHDDAIRFGLLGASAIAPTAFINPASSHPDVIVAAVAARDKARAEAYAKKHRIPVVHSTYEYILQDTSIDAVYIALPNSLHYEWTLRAIRAGKHVLLEKPSCSNAEEARALFNHPMLKAPGAPILLEAFHYRFHPAWHAFLARIHSDPEAGRVKNALIQQYLMKGVFGADNIRWRFDLSGGTMMDFGTYAMNCLRQIFKQEPTEVLEATPRMVPGSSEAEQAMSASYRMGDGGTGSLIVDLCASPEGSLLSMLWPSRLLQMGWPRCEVELEEHTFKQLRRPVAHREKEYCLLESPYTHPLPSD